MPGDQSCPSRAARDVGAGLRASRCHGLRSTGRAACQDRNSWLVHPGNEVIAAEDFGEARFSCQVIEVGTKTSFEAEAADVTLIRDRKRIRIEVVSLAKAEVNYSL